MMLHSKPFRTDGTGKGSGGILCFWIVSGARVRSRHADGIYIPSLIEIKLFFSIKARKPATCKYLDGAKKNFFIYDKEFIIPIID